MKFAAITPQLNFLNRTQSPQGGDPKTQTVEILKELNFPALKGLSPDETFKKFKELLRVAYSEPVAVVYPDEEVRKATSR